MVNDPGVDAAFAVAKQTLERTYTTSTVMHFQLEPINALALEIHTGNQWQSLILPVLAKALGRNQDAIVLRTYILAGGFGRRLNGDYAVPAALAAKVMGKPVKMICTRLDDMRFDSPRSPSVQVVRMAFGDGAKVTAMDHQAAAPDGPPQLWRRAVHRPRPPRRSPRCGRDRCRSVQRPAWRWPPSACRHGCSSASPSQGATG